MKKTKSFIPILAIAALMLTGCSNAQTPRDDINNINMTGKELGAGEIQKKDSGEASRTDLGEEPSDAGSDTEAAGEVFFGRVKSIVGNEVEIDIGLIPDWNENEDIKPGDKKKPGVSEIKVAEKENPPGFENYHAPDPDSPIFGEDGEINLTYTGESRTLIIPAGAGIRNILGGKATLEDIKKGSVLMIKPKTIDGKGAAIDTLTIIK